MEQLRPTVKRDLSLFSIKAWQYGYVHALWQKLNWHFPIVFYFDGQKVNFYHLQTDFQYFKQHITPQLIENSRLFKQLNIQFLADISRAKQLIGNLDDIDADRLMKLIGDIMAVYIFVVSDAFVAAVPEAWASRHASESILYQLDGEIEQMIQSRLSRLSMPQDLAHVTLPSELAGLASGQGLHIEDMQRRLDGYILWQDQLITDQTWAEFCAQRGWLNPEVEHEDTSSVEVRGTAAFPGQARGRVVVVHNSRDLASVVEGDILVSVMTNVNYLPAFKRAAAEVTDEGGVTCHAAILARELAKPCVVGTKSATKLLRSGDIVVVDAINGIVTPLHST